ncbi:DEP domain-containing mTOR-interacting protein-like [Leptodactylus fuscus]|uniref:DEP domain-containing mTOR-interacting protein-like n=1 Tax=Leptodactylus fuscus TaxID=238119 RepID=UPI003F4F1BF4
MEFISSNVQKQAEIFQRQTEIRLAGEQLRLRLHNAKLIKDRGVQRFTYPSSFVAKEVVDWLLARKEAPHSEIAVSIMQKLFESDVIHHVCDAHATFKEDKLFYRFRNDDGTSIPTNQMRMAVRCQRIYEKMINEDNSIIKVRTEGSRQYRRTFFGSEILDWLVKHGEVHSRADGEKLCKTLVDYGLIRHVTGRYKFCDSNMLFQFTINFRRKRKLTEILGDPAEARQDSPDSPFSLEKLSDELPQSSFVCVLKKPVTLEELLAPGAPYFMKKLTVVGDDLGWGFVVRGNGPCHVQALDPGGPAQRAGMKIRHFIKSVNGCDCLKFPYQKINQLVGYGPKHAIIEVLEHID